MPEAYCRYQSEESRRQPIAANASTCLFAQIIVTQHTATIASLSLYDNPSISYHGAATMLFGDIKLPADNTEAWMALLQKAEDTARAAGKDYLLGPMNGSTWREYRLPLQGDAPLFSGDIQLPAIWGKRLQQAGFKQAETYHSSLSIIDSQPESHTPEGVTIRVITPESLTSDLLILYPLCMRAFAQAPYFTSLSEAAFAAQYEAARSLLQFGLSHIALHGKTAVAFTLAYADMLDPERKTAVIKTFARDPAVHIRGLVKTMIATLYHTAWNKGYRQAIHAFMHDHNPSVRRSEEFGGSLLRSYALYAKNLHDGG